MRRSVFLGVVALAVGHATPGFAQDRPVTDQRPDAEEVVATPLTDLNLRKDEIPELLQRAVEAPYDLAGLGDCSALINEVRKFDIMLGDDFDLPGNGPGGLSAGAVGKMAVGSLIPFRGLIREVSGARKQQERLETAIRAGIARRAFLKGIGAQRGCAYPARPARADDIARIAAQRDPEAAESDD
ncbi:MAG: hypothetical protein AB3N06_03910 [Erythrobacter sp.]